VSTFAPDGLGRLAINQATIPRWTAEEAIVGCARAGYGAIGLWRDRVAECGAGRAASLARSEGIAISSLCRGGWFLGSGAAEERHERMRENFRAVDEAAELGAATLVLVSGPAPTKDLEAGRREVRDAIAELAGYAAPAGVSLAIEPMHPMYCGDRSVVVTLAQALEVASSIGGDVVGVMIDSYHLWWDPALEAAIAAAGGRILGLQLADWIAPPPDPLNGRGMLGDGTIDLRHFKALVDATGYVGPIEIEVFNPAVWQIDPEETLRTVAARYATLVV